MYEIAKNSWLEGLPKFQSLPKQFERLSQAQADLIDYFNSLSYLNISILYYELDKIDDGLDMAITQSNFDGFNSRAFIISVNRSK